MEKENVIKGSIIGAVITGLATTGAYIYKKKKKSTEDEIVVHITEENPENKKKDK